ncbi:Pr6Pr family membrane protein [Agromyces sp. SYSU K20354]|uniref:Pr6Pr family membrane protein n=1 Tax=Agromyces cavernae TaxID=2898659 RepID=UPI001E34E4DE|nr:Pr6Pr family membrane protein [Agromyces cavernae]MCD2441814.1 Pr6Pr family membrane protein [Agromyces cavernae]
MTQRSPLVTAASSIALVRMVEGVLCIAVLALAYGLRVAAGDSNLFDYFGYFTNQTSLLASVALIATGMFAILGRHVPGWLSTQRGIATACLLVVAVVYNVLVPGAGSAPPWVSVILHVVFPIAVTLDWALVGDRPPLSWRRLWVVLPYPLLWVGVVLARGATDGWVPYGFLLPERGLLSLTAHVVGLLGALLAAGALVWAASRLHVPRPIPTLPR